jgi:branched-chain amino acid transport system substrate-binding protein
MKLLGTGLRLVMVAALAPAGVTAAAEDGIGKNSIVVGQSVALTGPGASLAAPFHQGAKLYFDRVNAGGGINGRKIELVTLDDRGWTTAATRSRRRPTPSNCSSRACSRCSATTARRR